MDKLRGIVTGIHVLAAGEHIHCAYRTIDDDYVLVSRTDYEEMLRTLYKGGTKIKQEKRTAAHVLRGIHLRRKVFAKYQAVKGYLQSIYTKAIR